LLSRSKEHFGPFPSATHFPEESSGTFRFVTYFIWKTTHF